VWPFGLYGSGMAGYVLRELEIGARAAMCEDDEACGFGPLADVIYAAGAQLGTP
jgi:hypothetical protein